MKVQVTSNGEDGGRTYAIRLEVEYPDGASKDLVELLDAAVRGAVMGIDRAFLDRGRAGVPPMLLYAADGGRRVSREIRPGERLELVVSREVGP